MPARKRRKTMTWKEAIDRAFEESKWELDKLREYDLKAAKKPVRA